MNLQIINQLAQLTYYHEYQSARDIALTTLGNVIVILKPLIPNSFQNPTFWAPQTLDSDEYCFSKYWVGDHITPTFVGTIYRI